MCEAVIPDTTVVASCAHIYQYILSDQLIDVLINLAMELIMIRTQESGEN